MENKVNMWKNGNELIVDVNSCQEFVRLAEQAKEEARKLMETINALENFEVKFKISVD